MSTLPGLNAQLDALITAVQRDIETAKRLACTDAILLLQMAELSLRMRRHDISDEELSAFSDLLLTRVHSVEGMEKDGFRQNVVFPHFWKRAEASAQKPDEHGSKKGKARRRP